jgi:hypothetical protein
MKKLFKTQLTGVMVFLLTVALFASCKKKSNDLPSTDKYPLTNLTLTLTGQTLSSSGGIWVKYDVKNISAKNYIVQDNVFAFVAVRISVFATDGTAYTQDYTVDDLLAGKTDSEEHIMAGSSSKVIDASKTKLEFVYKTP